MKNRIMYGTIAGLLTLTLTNCGTLYHNMNQSELYQPSPYSEVMPLIPKDITPAPEPVSDSWQDLMSIGPGSDALVTMSDGTLKGGQIITVTLDSLFMKTAGKEISIARSEIALVEIKGSSGALAGGIIGFLISGVGLTAIISQGQATPEGWLVGISLLGIPGGLLGALIGSSTGGDVEIVP